MKKKQYDPLFLNKWSETVNALFGNKKILDKTPIRPIRFYCIHCGGELFSLMDLLQHEDDTLKEYFHQLCSDCELQIMMNPTKEGVVEIPKKYKGWDIEIISNINYKEIRATKDTFTEELIENDLEKAWEELRERLDNYESRS